MIVSKYDPGTIAQEWVLPEDFLKRVLIKQEVWDALMNPSEDNNRLLDNLWRIFIFSSYGHIFEIQ